MPAPVPAVSAGFSLLAVSRERKASMLVAACSVAVSRDGDHGDGATATSVRLPPLTSAASGGRRPAGGGARRQVHRAVLEDGTEVAVKVIYPSLRKEMASDFAMFRCGRIVRACCGSLSGGWRVLRLPQLS